MRALTIAGTAAAAAWSLPAISPHVPSLADALGIERRLPVEATGVAVTFDDGPHPQGTPAVLEALGRARAVATFFLVGEQVERRPALAAEIAAAGHGVALHGYRHRNLLRLTPRQLADDLARVAAAVGEATGRAPWVYRPPYGIFSAGGLRLVRRLGLTPMLWSRWGVDWQARATPDSITARAATGLRGGEVLLLHDADYYSSAGSWRATAAAVPRILDAVEAEGLHTVAVPGSGA